MRNFIATILLISIAISASSQKAPDFQVTNIDGNQHHLYSILADSNYVLIDFFFVDCSYCQYYAPHVNQSYTDFGCNNHNVFVIGIDYNDDSAAVRQFQQDYNLDYPLVSGLDGGGDSVISSYGIQAYPTVMIIGPDSNIWKNLKTPTTSNINDMLENMGAKQTPCNTSVEDSRDEAGFSAWPNPVDQQMNIRWEKSRSAKLTIFSLSGKKLKNHILKPNQTMTLNLSQLSNGLYLMHITSKNKSIRYFFLKK